MTDNGLVKRMAGAFAATALLGQIASVPAMAETRQALRLERVVMLMRHGVRSPTDSQPISSIYGDRAWPRWPVTPGQLTPRGAMGAALLGRLDRAYLAKRGLIAQGCPAPGTVAIAASSAQRAIDTARAWSSAAFPSCGLTLTHPTSDEQDALFHPLSAAGNSFDGHLAWDAATRLLPRGGINALKRENAGSIRTLERVLGCRKPACDLMSAPATLLEKSHDRPNLTGVFEVGTTASQSILLEYLEGMPLANVGWGRADRKTIEKLLAFHPLEFRYSNGPHFVARAAGGPLAKQMADALAHQEEAGKVTILTGHDTNIADVASLLNLHWHIPSYPANDAPPISALGFELWSDGGAGRFVRAFFRSPTMKGLRVLRSVQPVRQYLDIPGCGRAARPRSCSIEDFRKLVAAAVDPN